MRVVLQLILCIGLTLTPAAAVEWRQAALWGGDVRALLIDPERPERIFAGTSSGQVLKSENGGADWVPAGLPVAFPGWVVSDLLLDEAGRPEVGDAQYILFGGDVASEVSQASRY